jgi:hypothetical protein
VLCFFFEDLILYRSMKVLTQDKANQLYIISLICYFVCIKVTSLLQSPKMLKVCLKAIYLKVAVEM